MEVPLSAMEFGYVEARVRSGRSASHGEVLREALHLLMERDAGERRSYQEWRERTRRGIDEAYEESFTEEGLDGPAVFEELRIKLELRGSRPS